MTQKKRVEALLKSKSWTLSQLSVHTGYSNSWLRSVFNGRTHGSEKLWETVADALDTDIKWVRDGKKKRISPTEEVSAYTVAIPVTAPIVRNEAKDMFSYGFQTADDKPVQAQPKLSWWQRIKNRLFGA